MAEIQTLTCSNSLCRATLHVMHEFPVWHPTTPAHLKVPAVTAQSQPYLLRLRTESYCPSCATVVERADMLCTRCNTPVRDVMGQTCFRCTEGYFVLSHVQVM